MAGNYKLWAVGERIHLGSAPMRHVGVAGVAKTSSSEIPYLVANELICAKLAQALMLPVPPGFLVSHNDEKWFVSLNFNLAGEDLPPILSSKVAREHPELTTGIIVFDIWIANRDRHRGNVAFDSETGRLQIFDHGSALFVGGNDGRENIEHTPGLGIPNHCLLQHLQEDTYVAKWVRRIQQLPEWLITETLQEVGRDAHLIEDSMATAGSEFLLNRRANLMTLIHDHRAKFTSMGHNLLTLANPNEPA